MNQLSYDDTAKRFDSAFDSPLKPFARGDKYVKYILPDQDKKPYRNYVPNLFHSTLVVHKNTYKCNNNCF